jgi:hypothetical protein
MNSPYSRSVATAIGAEHTGPPSFWTHGEFLPAGAGRY